MKNLLSAAIALALSISFPGWAQTTPPAAPELARVAYLDVKPDMLAEWEDIQKAELNPVLKKAGVPWRTIWEPAAFGDRYLRVAVTPIKNFADFDGTPLLREHLGPDGANRLATKMRKCLNGARTYVMRLHRDLSIFSENPYAAKMAVVTNVRVTPGREADFERLVKSEVLPMLKKHGTKDLRTNQTMFGGNVNEWVFVTYIHNFARLDEGPPSKVLSPEEQARFDSKLAGVVESIERIVARINTDLSYMPSAAGGS